MMNAPTKALRNGWEPGYDLDGRYNPALNWPVHKAWPHHAMMQYREFEDDQVVHGHDMDNPTRF